MIKPVMMRMMEKRMKNIRVLFENRSFSLRAIARRQSDGKIKTFAEAKDPRSWIKIPMFGVRIAAKRDEMHQIVVMMILRRFSPFMNSAADNWKNSA